MPLVRPSSGLLRPSRHPRSIRCSKAPFTTSAARLGGAEQHYDPPSGWLWGDRPGQKYKKEGWEGMMFWGFGGSFVVATIAYVYKPDTSIQTWALEEARRRLEVEGILEDPEVKK